MPAAMKRGMVRSRSLKWARCLMLTAVALGCCPSPGAASESATASVLVTARISSRTSLKVSTEMLTFDVEDSAAEATAAVDFAAGARTHEGGDVTLSVAPLERVEPSGATGPDSVLTFSGIGAGTRSGSVAHGQSTLVGRWTGSGLRTGRLMFTLRTAARGRHAVPLQFVLSAP